MKKYLFILFAVGMFSCGDNETNDTPQCIKDQLEEFKETAPCEGDNLASWDFQGEKVYCYVSGSCGIAGALIEIYDGNCDLKCTMGSGLTSCNGVPWAENASNEQLIWIK